MRVATAVGALWALLLILLCPVAATATQVIAQTPRQLADGSRLVVQGTVLSQRSYWNESGTRILTEAEVQVDRSYKGSPPDRLRVVQMGGVVDGVKMTVAGATTWRPGEEVVLFLEPSLAQRWRVAGFSQGKYRIRRDPVTGVARVIAPRMDGVQMVGGSAAPRTMALDELLRSAGLNLREVR